jgi:UDP-N-acetyl-D-mannosaminuronate dehydrogenase
MRHLRIAVTGDRPGHPEVQVRPKTPTGRGLPIVNASNDHAPAHGHLPGPGIKGHGIAIGQNGKPRDADVQLTREQQRVVDDNPREIRKASRKSMAAHRIARANGC